MWGRRAKSTPARPPRTVDAPIRLVLLGNPRSGNTAFRRMLAERFGLVQLAFHDIGDIPTDLPDRVIIQIHTPWDPDFEEWLEARGFQTIALARHPLETLLSMLRFASFEPAVDRWLSGGLLRSVLGASPADDAFHRFAVGDDAGELLSVASSWWPMADYRVTHEDVLQRPESVLQRFDALVGGATSSLTTSVAAGSAESIRAETPQHIWMASSGYWTELIGRPLAAATLAAHPLAFQSGGFSIDAARDLTTEDVQDHWDQLAELSATRAR